MNLLLSYTRNQDNEYKKLNHIFLGVGEDDRGGEVHVWLKSCNSNVPMFNPSFSKDE